MRNHFLTRSPSAVMVPDIIALIFSAVAFLLWGKFLLIKFIYFGYYDWDLAMYAQATWALSHGTFHSSLFDTNFLTNHAEYIAFFIAPIYRLFPSALTLIFFKILSMTVGSYFIYLIAKKNIGPPGGLIFLLLYHIHPANIYMMIYEFHFENLAIAFVPMMYYFLIENKLLPFLTSAFFATLVKENISLVVMMFGIYALINKKTQKAGWVGGPLILGGLFFVLTMFVITPHLRENEGIKTSNQYLSLYWDNGIHDQPIGQIIKNNIQTRSSILAHPVNRKYAKDLFMPFNILPFLSPLTLMLGLTIFLQHFLAPTMTMHTLYYHYAATAIIFVFLASVQSLGYLKKILRPAFYLIFLVLTVTTLVFFTKIYYPDIRGRVVSWVDRLDPVRQKLLEKIPPGSPVVASFDFLARMTERKELFSLHNVWQNHATFTGRTPYVLSRDVSYALIDWKCGWIWNDLLLSSPETTSTYLQRLNHFYYSRPWHIVDVIEDFTVLSSRTGSVPASFLSENSAKPFSDIQPNFNLDIGKNLKLVALNIGNFSGRMRSVLPVELVWQSRERTNDFFDLSLIVMKNNQVMLKKRHPIGYTFNSTPLWTKGQFVREHYSLFIPGLEAGTYFMSLSVVNTSTNQLESFGGPDKSKNTIHINFTIK